MFKCSLLCINNFKKSNLQCLYQKLASNTLLYLQDHDLIAIQPEVSEALELVKPVVALESTIITHGMPYPNNIK